MATEAQLVSDINYSLAGDEYTRVGFRVTISSRYISSVSFLLSQRNNPTGDVTFTIRKTSDDALLGSKVWGDASSLPVLGSRAWKTATFSVPIYVNEEVRILCEYSGGDYSSAINIFCGAENSNIKGSEVFTSYTPSSYTDDANDDGTYSYEYSGGSTNAPSVTTQAVSDITATTATGNGNVTDLGAPLATQYGVCYAPFPNPTLDNATVTDETASPPATGAFTASLTNLYQDTLYYLKAYVKNEVGTFYGATATFTTSAGAPVLPLAVSTNYVTEIATTTALGHGAIDNNGGSDISQHGVCWGSSANPTYSVGGPTQTEEGATTVIGPFASLMTSLTAGTTYHMRAYAVNGTGPGYGLDVTFTTMAVGVPIVTTNKTTDVTPTTATGNGTIVNIGGSAITYRGCCWDSTINPTTTDSSSGYWGKTATAGGSKGDYSALITGLIAGTPVYMRFYATNTQGTGYGNNVLINELAGELLGGELMGVIGVKSETFVYTSKTGVQYYVQGVPF